MANPAAVYDNFLAFRRTSHVCAVTCFVGRLVPTLAPFERGYTHRTEHRGPRGEGERMRENRGRRREESEEFGAFGVRAETRT